MLDSVAARHVAFGTTMQIIAVANAKGGSGKTSIAVNLAEGLARTMRVLLIDADPQANATTWLLGHNVQTHGASEAMLDEVSQTSVLRTQRGGLFVMPSTRRLGTAAIRLASEIGGCSLLTRALSKITDFDYVVIDTRPAPPGGDHLLLSALYAADHVLVPVLPSAFALTGFHSVRRGLQQMAERTAARTALLGVVLFAVDSRERLPGQCREYLRGELGDKLFRAEIRKSAAAATLPSDRKTTWDAGADQRGAADYPLLVDEVRDRVEAACRG